MKRNNLFCNAFGIAQNLFRCQLLSCNPVRKSCFAILALCCTLVFVSCGSDEQHYVIGVSQCSEDSWRSKFLDELVMATYFNQGVEIRSTSAHDDSKLQRQQIDSLVASGIDILVVSPNQIDNLTDVLDKVYDKGIPVILYDRKTNSKKFNAFMGADNYLIGQSLASYLVSKIGSKGNVIEIGGLKDSSPAAERHAGFSDFLRNYPDIHIVAYGSGDWTEASGEVAMRRILKDYDGKIDAVYGANDRMAVGARRVMREVKRDNKDIVYLGIDALPTTNGGMAQVRDSVLTASAIYPTHGDELIELALKILKGEPFNRETMLRTSIVTHDNASVLLMQHEEIVRRAANLGKMHEQAGNMSSLISAQRTIIGLVLLLAMVFVVLLTIAVNAYRQKHRLYQEIQIKSDEVAEVNVQLSHTNSQLKKLNEQLATEKETAERQRDELELQRDKLIEVSMHRSFPEGDSEDDILDGNEQEYKKQSEFMMRFSTIVEEHLSNSELSVEDIGSEMCLSRVQLYRKVKALTGQSPVEIIRETRLRRAHQLLADSSLNISEIAYRVGFSSPSYFAKCYKDLFGKSPTEVQKR